MCGIAGSTGPALDGRLERMTEALRHRGPDARGFFDSDRVRLGIRRLAIVDLVTGDQPKVSRDGRVTVVFNGEVYNAPELRRELEVAGHELVSDHAEAETIAELHAAHGIAFVERLVGMFAIALVDREEDALYLVRDRLGKKPLYYRYDADAGTLEFASEFNALAPEGRAAHLDRASLGWYFSQKAMPSDASIDVRVRQVPPGSHVCVPLDGGAPATTRYWSFPAPARPPDGVREEELVEEVDALVRESVALRMRADVEVGAYLSGGVDSSLIVALASERTATPLRTYCLVYDEDIYEKSADRRFAALIAERHGTRHREVTLRPEDLAAELPVIAAHFGQPNSAVVSNWFISRVMGRDLKVALSGDGADELFGSYFLHRASALLEQLEARGETVPAGAPEAEAAFAAAARDQPLAALVDRFAVFPDAELARLLRPDVYAAASVTPRLRSAEAELRATTPLNRILEFDCRHLLCEQVLNYADVLSMAHSLEVRTPFLDHRLVERVMSLPAGVKIRGGRTKHLLKEVARRHLPGELVDRQKEGFVEPGVLWLGRELRDFCLEHLRGPGFNRLGLLEDRYVERLVGDFYRDGDFFLGKRVWSLLMFALWEQAQ